MYRLSFQTGPLAGQTREVAQEVLLVGEDPDCGCPLPGAGLAPRHARLEENAAGVFVGPAAPGAVVLCGGVPVDGSRCLREGDILEIGGVRLAFHRGASPLPRRRPRISRGIMQPLAILACLAFLASELFLLRFAIVWPDEVYDFQTEENDREEAERIRERLAEEEELEHANRAATAAAALSLPGSTPSTNAVSAGASPDSATAATGSAASSPAAPPPVAAPSADPATAAATADALEVLTSADFAPVSPETELSTLPPISAADPRIADAQRVLAQAIAAAQFADYAQAERLFLDLHRAAPGFLPTYEEHAKMLEMQGHYSEALLRWRQLRGLAPDNSPFRERAIEGIQRANARLEDKTLPRPPDGAPPPDSGVSFGETEVVRLADTPQNEVEEMRVLRTSIEFSPAAARNVPRNAVLRVVLDFFDRTPDGTVFLSPALVSVSPDALRVPPGLPATVALEATYVVPRGLRHRASNPAEYDGYRIRVFAGDRLLAEQAKPKRLLDFTETP